MVGLMRSGGQQVLWYLWHKSIGSYARQLANLKLQSQNLALQLQSGNSVLLKQLHIGDTSLCIIIPERQKLLSWTSCKSNCYKTYICSEKR